MKKEPAFLPIALEAVKKAEKIILDYFDKGVKAQVKDDHTPVTLADQTAEKVIVKTIRATFPNHNFHGEEGKYKKTKSPFIWIIDPIDGTKSFIRKMSFFATQLALMRDNQIILGISNAPLLKELLYAQQGKGAFINKKPILLPKRTRLSQAYISHGGLKYFVRSGLVKNLAKLSDKTWAFRGLGDFWSYHMLLKGHIDAVIEGGTKLEDVAALSLIITEAGGTVSDLSGKPVSKTTRSLLVANNSRLHKTLLNYFN